MISQVSISRPRGYTFSPNRNPKKMAAIIKRAATKYANRKKHKINCKRPSFLRNKQS